MNMFYGVLCYAMAVHNFMKGMDGMNVMNFVLAAMWLAIGIFFTVKHVKELKKAKRKKQMQEEREQNG